mmetsp:Transcript_26554/g.62324  ORF Transcript_26554/g.62324 Transcript_26554/m.62324 type:complete len:113 (-) Transcript_26554:209-547(-)
MSTRVIIIHNENWLGSTTSIEMKVMLKGRTFRTKLKRNVFFAWRKMVRNYMGGGFAERNEDRQVDPHTCAKIMEDSVAYADFEGNECDGWTEGLAEVHKMAATVASLKGGKK